MKTRSDFVTNSSSSSFLVIGLHGTNKTAQKVLAELTKKVVESQAWKDYTSGPEAAECIRDDYDGDELAFLEGSCCLEEWLEELGEKMEIVTDDNGLVAVGLGSSVLEEHSIKEARQMFVDYCRDELGVEIPLSEVDKRTGTIYC